MKRVAQQVASALEFIHGHDLVHRDIKPENVLMLDSHCCRVKLADFGLTQKRGTMIRMISGTLPYMAPELCAMVVDEGETEAKAPPLSVEPSLDTWAFGVLIFCILTGFFPWDRCMLSDDFYEEFAEWCQQPSIVDVPSQWKKFSPAGLEMFSKMLTLDATQRCSVSEVKAFLGKDWLRTEATNGLVGGDGKKVNGTISPNMGRGSPVREVLA